MYTVRLNLSRCLFVDICKYIYQRYYFFSLIEYIPYLLKLRGVHRVFVITIKKCKCAILWLALLRFDRYYRYLYALLFFPCEICNSEQYRSIVGYSPTPVQKLSAISCKYYYYGWIHITDSSCYLLLGFVL